MERPIGLTKDVGWQFCIRRTIPSSKEKVWDFMFSNVGEQIWMQHVEKEFTTFKPYSHIRTKWRLPGWDNNATIQLRIMGNENKATIAFHVERLLSKEQRVQTSEYLSKVMDNLILKLK